METRLLLKGLRRKELGRKYDSALSPDLKVMAL